MKRPTKVDTYTYIDIHSNFKKQKLGQFLKSRKNYDIQLYVDSQ